MARTLLLIISIALFSATANAFLPKLFTPAISKDLGGDTKWAEKNNELTNETETVDAESELKCPVDDEHKEIKEMLNTLLTEIRDLKKEVADLRNDIQGSRVDNSSNWENSNSSSVLDDEKSLLTTATTLPREIRCEPNRLATSTLENGKKYFFSKRKMDWYKAKLLCESNKMHLASPKTEAENSAIYEYLKNQKIFDSLWLSASDVGRMGQGFVWHDGEELAKDSPLWDTDSPYSMGTDFGEEFCVTTGRKLREQMCVDEKFFVCELPPECY